MPSPGSAIRARPRWADSVAVMAPVSTGGPRVGTARTVGGQAVGRAAGEARRGEARRGSTPPLRVDHGLLAGDTRRHAAEPCTKPMITTVALASPSSQAVGRTGSFLSG